MIQGFFPCARFVISVMLSLFCVGIFLQAFHTQFWRLFVTAVTSITDNCFLLCAVGAISLVEAHVLILDRLRRYVCVLTIHSLLTWTFRLGKLGLL